MLRNPKHWLLGGKVNVFESSFKLTAMDEFKEMSTVCEYLTQKNTSENSVSLEKV